MVQTELTLADYQRRFELRSHQCAYVLQDGRFCCREDIGKYWDDDGDMRQQRSRLPAYRVPLCTKHEAQLRDVMYQGVLEKLEYDEWGLSLGSGVRHHADVFVPPLVEGALPSESAVYYAQRGDGAIKIGTSTNVRKRVASFRLLTPIEVVAIEPGGRVREGELHWEFRSARMRGEAGREWFTPVPRLLGHIRRLRSDAAGHQRALPGISVRSMNSAAAWSDAGMKWP
jgi:hypothetical protein